MASHEANIEATYRMTQGGPGASIDYVWETGKVFLETREGTPVSLTVLRRPGQEPTWGVSWTELVDTVEAQMAAAAGTAQG